MNYKIISLTLLTSVSLSMLAQKEISSKIEEVTVYLSGAEVNRKAKANLVVGKNEFKLTNLSPYIQPNSLQVKVNNQKVTVVSASSEVNYWSKNQMNKRPEIKAIDDSIKELEFQLAIRSSKRKVYNEEKSLLQANKKLGGANTGVDIEDLMDAADFYRERMTNIETRLLDIAESEKEIHKKLEALHSRRNHLFNGVKNTGEITVKLASKYRGNANITVSYMVNNAGWSPFYDIRAYSIDEPVDLVYKAKVQQNTGADWNNVKLKLSTGNPSYNNTQPVFSTWYLQYYTPSSDNRKRYDKERPRAQGYSPADDEAPLMESVTVLSNKAESNSTANFTTVTQNTINTTFDIAIPYTIKSDKKGELVEIQNYELPVEYEYFAMPRLDREAFLLAKITEWGSYNLLPGDANIYFENTFVGKSYIETNVANDTLDVSLGRDKSIVIERNKIKDFCKNSSFGGNKKSTRGYEIKVHNNKSVPIEIKVIDQIPISTIKEIEISMIEDGGAQYDATTGKLTWTIKVPANATQKIQYKFEVKYPKDKVISNL